MTADDYISVACGFQPERSHGSVDDKPVAVSWPTPFRGKMTGGRLLKT